MSGKSDLRNPADIPLPKTVRDRDIIQDKEGRIYVGLGYIQPEDRILAFLKYVPDNDGEWISGGRHYQRVFWGGVTWVRDSVRLLPKKYIVHDSHFGTTLLEVPRTEVLHYFSPQERLKAILEMGPQDRLEASAASLTRVLHDCLDIDSDSLGVGGSVLWKAHDVNRSDLNMNVYGYGPSWKLQHAYSELGECRPDTRVREDDEWARGVERLVSRAPSLRPSDIRMLLARRKAIYHEGRPVGVTPVLCPEETPIRHGTEMYETIAEDPVVIRLEITNADYGIFTPSLYRCRSDDLDEINSGEVRRVLIYEGAFRGLLLSGDMIEAKGTLQRVVSMGKDSESFCQIMIGTKAGAGQEYVRLLEARED
jgi:predicted nucleotidyltransferase